MRRPRSCLCLFVSGALTLLSACARGGVDDAAVLTEGVNVPGLTVAVCGTVDAFVAPSDGAPGYLTIDGRTWLLVEDAELVEEQLFEPGERVCIEADLDTDRRMETCVAHRDPSTDAGSRATPSSSRPGGRPGA